MFTHIKIPELPKIIQKNKVNGKRYYEIPSGEEYPSITTVLGDKEKLWLDDWRNMLGHKKASKETTRCAKRGTIIHSLAEKYLKNEKDFKKGVESIYVNDFNKLRLRLNKINNIHAQEVSLYSNKLKIAGTVDCIAEYDKVLSVIDFKTSTNNKTREMIHDYFKQCTAYAIAWHERTGQAIEDIVIIISVEKGLMPLVFKEKIANWIPLLLKDINDFQEKNK